MISVITEINLSHAKDFSRLFPVTFTTKSISLPVRVIDFWIFNIKIVKVGMNEYLNKFNLINTARFSSIKQWEKDIKGTSWEK